MKLISVNSATATQIHGLLSLTITADFGNGNESSPYGWSRGEVVGIAPQIDAWFDANPDFPIAPYVAPQPTMDEIRHGAFKADANYQALLTQLKAATPAQVQTYITNNVTDLPSARAMLIKMALVLALVANGS